MPPEGRGASVAMGVFTLDAALRVRAWDPWLEACTGIRAADAHDRPLAEVVPSIAERGLLARFTAVLETGQIQILAPAFHQYLVPCPPSAPSPHFTHMQQRVTLGPLREGTAIVGVMATIEDVTARLDAERALAAALRGGDPEAREAAARQLARSDQLEDPDALGGALRDEHWRVRRAAVHGLVRHADRDMLAALLTALRTEHGDFNVLSSALQLFAATDIDLTAPLAELLSDPNPDLRMQAALALGQQDQPAAVAALIQVLGDDDVNVRFHAIEALGRLRAADAVDALAAIAESGDFFLAFPAIDALARIRDSRVAGRLVPLLEAPELCDAAAAALGELAEADAIPPLVAALNAGRGTLAVVRAVAQLHERYERFGAGPYVADTFQQALRPSGAQHVLDALALAPPDDTRAVVLVLGWLRGAAVERALARLLGRPDIRSDVIEAIVRQGEGIVDLLVEQLDTAEDDETREAAIGALGRIGDRRATPALARALSGERRIAVAAAGALAAVGDGAAFEPLLGLVGHPDVVVRQAVIGALNSLGHRDMPARVRTLLDAADPATRESAVRIAGYFGYPECLEALLERCSDPDENVRKAALEQLPHLDDTHGLALLARALQHDTPRARAAAAQALGNLHAPSATTLLLEASRDTDVWVRYFAARALGRHGNDEALARLGELAANDPAMPVRLAAIESMGSLADPRVLDALLPQINSSSREVAESALLAVGCLSDARAFEALMGALRSDDAERRLAAVKGLSRMGTDASVGALQWTAGADAEPAVAGAAVEGLATLARRRDEPADAAIRALLALTVDPRRREAAIGALGRVPHRISSVASGLRAADPQVRRATVEALSRLKHGDASAAIRAALDDDDAGVRRAAVVALHRLGASGLSHVFATLAREDPSRDVRRAAAAALAHDRAATFDGDERS
ncbi:MAG TPA: HEAT repeat domain-containing protein [Vicinamibacterales bacterium]|nr:HEAT repeat domain-containing protein [Vicinamibacterales bacterium]